MFDLIGFLTEYWELFVGLAGVAAVIPPFVSLLKVFGVVNDGEAGKVQSIVNTVFFAIFLGVKLFDLPVDVGGVDAVLGQVAQVLIVILTLLGQFGISKLAYERAWKGRLGWLGYSYS